jgi:hypothetical protein
MIDTTLNLLLALPALAIALALKPWRLLHGAPPWPALATWALMPLLWSLDVTTAAPLLQPLSGVCILLLMLGWPLTVLALLPVGGVMLLMTDVDAAGALHRVVWLGLMPATLAMALGGAIRRWLPRTCSSTSWAVASSPPRWHWRWRARSPPGCSARRPRWTAAT